VRAVRAALVVALLAPLMPTAVPTASAAPAIVRTPTDPLSIVRLRSDAEGHRWRGAMTISFENAGASVLEEVYLRLWSNGVRGCDPLAIRVANVRGGTPGRLRQRCTTVRVQLDDPLVQGERTRLRFSLRIDVPKRNDRFGHLGGLSLLGSALPALAVHDDAEWNLPPFVDLGESFYSVAGRYRVTLDTPIGLETPTTGTRTGRRVEGSRWISTYTARQVRDFEWAAARLSRLVGHAGDTRVVVSYQPARVSLRTARAMRRHAVRSMHTFSDAFGDYPYREVDVVLLGAATFGGMEYPTIVFSEANRLTIAHELAHQWWYGVVGSDQFSEPWLDEGLATWSQYLPFNPWRRCDTFSWPSGSARMTNDMSYWREHPGAYGRVAYLGGGCMLAQLAEGFGLARFERLLGRYAAAHWLDNARTGDLQAIVERMAARHWAGFDADTFWSTWRVD